MAGTYKHSKQRNKEETMNTILTNFGIMITGGVIFWCLLNVWHIIKLYRKRKTKI